MFYLCVIETNRDMDRVALLSEPAGEVIQEVDAGGWQEAREHIDDRGLVHVAGHGWFKSLKQGFSV